MTTAERGQMVENLCRPGGKKKQLFFPLPFSKKKKKVVISKIELDYRVPLFTRSFFKLVNSVCAFLFVQGEITSQDSVNLGGLVPGKVTKQQLFYALFIPYILLVS